MGKLTRVLLAGAFVLSTVATADARPQYKKAFDALYSKKTACALCHPNKESKKERNEYGDALGKALGEKNVKDVDAVNKALKAVEEKMPKE